MPPLLPFAVEDHRSAVAGFDGKQNNWLPRDPSDDRQYQCRAVAGAGPGGYAAGSSATFGLVIRTASTQDTQRKRK